MNRYPLLALGLTLTLLCAGSRANIQAVAVGADKQPGATGLNDQPATAPANAQPSADQATPQAAAGQANQQPTNGQTNPQGNAGQSNQQPEKGQAIQQPNNAPTNPAPNADQTGAAGTAPQGQGPTSEIRSPLREFVTRQVDEVAALQPQFDAFRAANRPDAVRVLYHMVRDNVLVADAARNLLARRGQVSRPVAMSMPMPVTADTPEQILRQDIEAHQQALSGTQQLMANATSPEERSIFQRAIDATQQHLNWLQSLAQGQQVALGFFGPTMPLSRIAGYREEVGQAPAAGSGQGMRRARAVNYHRGMRARHHHRYHYRIRSQRMGYYR